MKQPGNIPQDGAVRAARGERFAVGGKCQCIDPAWLAFPDAQHLAAVRVDEPQLGQGAGGEQLALGRKGDGEGPAFVVGPDAFLFAGGDFPEADGSVVGAGGGERLAIIGVSGFLVDRLLSVIATKLLWWRI